jgi:hypothetical protein
MESLMSGNASFTATGDNDDDIEDRDNEPEDLGTVSEPQRDQEPILPTL